MVLSDDLDDVDLSGVVTRIVDRVYHDRSDCAYDETPPEEWSKGLVGFRPTAVFDVSQIEGELLPELETEATGDAVENPIHVIGRSYSSINTERRLRITSAKTAKWETKRALYDY